MLNKQKIFDDVVKALHAQGEKSVDHPGSSVCCYRKIKDDGTILKCGIGHIIPDDKYDPEIDDMCLRAGHKDVRGLIDPAYGKPEAVCWEDDDRKFLNEIQISLHDGLSEDQFVLDLEHAAAIFTAEHNLAPYVFS